MASHVETGAYSIFDSGCMMTYDYQSDLRLNLEFENSFNLNLVFEFEDNSSEKDVAIKPDVNATTNTITFTCINFNNVLGSGLRTPVKIAQVNGKKVLISFWVRVNGDKVSREITYTIFIEK